MIKETRTNTSAIVRFHASIADFCQIRLSSSDELLTSGHVRLSAAVWDCTTNGLAVAVGQHR